MGDPGSDAALAQVRGLRRVAREAGGADGEPVEKVEPSGFVKARRSLGKLSNFSVSGSNRTIELVMKSVSQTLSRSSTWTE